MIVDPENIGQDTFLMLLCVILADIWWRKRYFDNGGTNLHIKLSKTHVIMSTITLFWSLTLITRVYTSYFVGDTVKNRFFNNALICIKTPHGTCCWLVNIANRFIRIFSDLVIPIKSIFHGMHGTPLFRLDYTPDPLRSIPEPLRCTPEPLRCTPEPLRSTLEPLRSTPEPLLRLQNRRHVALCICTAAVSCFVWLRLRKIYIPLF